MFSRGMFSLARTNLSHKSELLQLRRCLVTIIPGFPKKKPQKHVVIMSSTRTNFTATAALNAIVNSGTIIVVGGILFIKGSIIFGVVCGTLNFGYDYIDQKRFYEKYPTAIPLEGGSTSTPVRSWCVFMGLYTLAPLTAIGWATYFGFLFAKVGVSNVCFAIKKLFVNKEK